MKTPVHEINNLGLGNVLYFFTLINLCILLIIFFLVYGVYSLVTNIMAAYTYNKSVDVVEEAENSFYGILALSLGSKQLDEDNWAVNNKYYSNQSWVGVATVVIWGGFLAYVKVR